jgi:hypothetical protein
MLAIINHIYRAIKRATHAALLVLISALPWQSAEASEAQARPASVAPEARVTERLARDGYEMVGAPVRKGDLVVLSATRTGTTWRLVIDPRTGGIIGQRPVGSPLPVQP